MKQEFKIEGEYIELIQLLKALGIAETGGHAKYIVEQGEVIRNGEVETRKRAKLIPGDIIEIDDLRIILVKSKKCDSQELNYFFLLPFSFFETFFLLPSLLFF